MMVFLAEMMPVSSPEIVLPIKLGYLIMFANCGSIQSHILSRFAARGLQDADQMSRHKDGLANTSV